MFCWERAGTQSPGESLDKTNTRYKKEIGAKMTKLMTNSANETRKETTIKILKLGTMTRYRYLEPVISGEGLKPKYLSRIAQSTAAPITLNPLRD